MVGTLSWKNRDSASTWVDVSDQLPPSASNVSYIVETGEGVECDFEPAEIYTIKIICNRKY